MNKLLGKDTRVKEKTPGTSVKMDFNEKKINKIDISLNDYYKIKNFVVSTKYKFACVKYL